MKPCVVFIALMGVLLGVSSCVSAMLCDVSIPQKSNGPCTAIRNAELAQDRKTFTLKVDESLHGFALLNLTMSEVIEVAGKDPFTRRYLSEYVGMLQANVKIFQQYNSTIPFSQEINDISEYLPLAQYFQLAPELVLGDMYRVPSRFEEFIDNSSEWISDRYFTQQRLAGINPMSLRRVSIHGEGQRKCTVKTTDGRWCHFPFTYKGKTYYSCTKTDYYKPWCSTTEIFKGRWGKCAEKKSDKEEGSVKDCSVKTTKGEWCHFPFVYKGVTYESCKEGGYYGSWCATIQEYKYRYWGYCAEKRNKQEFKEPVGLDWNTLNQTLNHNFDWNKAVQDAFQSDDQSLEDAIKQNRIYALRYEECDNLPRSEDLTDFDPRRTMWDPLSPIALFASIPVGNKNELVPVAIQMHFKPDSDVFTPSDGDNWLIAKLNVQATDYGYVQIVEHLAKSHYLAEPFCVCQKRNLPDMHPLGQLLKYHCREITIPNSIGIPLLVAEGQSIDRILPFGNEGTFELVRAAHPLATWGVTDFRRGIKKRGLDDKKLLPYFPYRDDGERIVLVMEHLVEKYVDLYYNEDKDVREDVELQSFVNEVSLNGTGPNGGIGSIQGFPASVDSKRELCDIVSRIIFHVTLFHVAVNYGLSDYGEYIPNQPTKLYHDTRVEAGSFSVYTLPNRLTSVFQDAVSINLARLRFDSLFDYGNELQDIKAVNLVNRFYSHLMNVVQPQLQQENRKRKKRAQLTYPSFIPRWIPNGVET